MGEGGQDGSEGVVCKDTQAQGRGLLLLISGQGFWGLDGHVSRCLVAGLLPKSHSNSAPQVGFLFNYSGSVSRRHRQERAEEWR